MCALSQRSASSRLMPSSAMSSNRYPAAAVGRVSRVNRLGFVKDYLNSYQRYESSEAVEK